MIKRLLTEKHRAVGHWHVAGHPDDLLPGELTYEPDRGLRLDVVGHFGGGFPQSLSLGESGEEHAVVLGETSDQEITLYGCTQANQTFKIPGHGSTTYQPSMALLGAHDSGEDPLSADQVTVRIPVLDAWIPMSGLSVSITSDDPEGTSLKGYSNRYEPIEGLNIDLDWGRLRVTPAATFKGSGTFGDRSASINEWFDFVLELDEDTPFNDILNERVGPLVDLATLVTSHVATPIYIGLMAPVENLDGTPADRRSPLDVLFQQGWGDVSKDAKVEDRRFLLPARRPESPPVAEIVQRWYVSRNRFKRTMDMLFGMERSPRGTYTEVRFLTLSHAAEAMHRDQELPQERYTRTEYKHLQKAALDSIKDEAAKGFLKEQLRYAIDLSFKERLIALRDHSLGPGSNVISNEVITRIVKARNDLIHSSTSQLRRLESPASIYFLSQYVKWLIRSCLLLELGLNATDVAHLLQSNERFSWLTRSAANEGIA